MASASFSIFQNNFGACRLSRHINILSPSLSIQPLMSSSCCLPLVYSHPHWLQGLFQSSKHPAAFSPWPFLQQWYWEGLSLAALPASPCLLKAEGPARLLNASPAVLLKHSCLHIWEKCWASSGSLKDLISYKAQLGHWECLTSSWVCCFSICSLGVPGNVCIPGCVVRGDRVCFRAHGEGLELQPQVDAGAKRKETCAVN